MHLVNLLAYAASAAVLATFCMSTMIPLRIIGLVSNVLFMAYGYVDQLYPVLLLHAICMRSFGGACAAPGTIYRLVREMRRVPRRDLAIQSLPPYNGASKIWRDRNARAERRAGRRLISGGRRNRGRRVRKVLHPARRSARSVYFHQATNALHNRVPDRLQHARTDRSKAKQLYFQDRSFSFAGCN